MAARGARAAAGDAGDRVSQPTSLGSERGPICAAFRQGLKEAGYVEGENVAIEYRWAEDQYDRLPAMAADLVRRKVAVIAAAGGRVAAVAAKAATATIPIVFIVGDDPVRLGLVASLARPGGNVTGVNLFSGRVGREAAGVAARAGAHSHAIAVLVNPTNPRCRGAIARRAGGRARHGAANPGPQRQHQRAISMRLLRRLVRERPDALFVGGGAFFTEPRVQLATLAARHAIPTIYRARVRRGRRADELRCQSG